MESEHEFGFDFRTVLVKMRTFFEILSTEQGSGNKCFTIIGDPGAGKTYICNQFQSEVSEKQKDIRILWVETFIENGLLKFLEEFNGHSCDFHDCHVDHFAHHLKLFVRNLKKSQQRHLIFIPIFNETTATFATDLSRTLSKSTSKKSVWMVQLLNCPNAEAYRKGDEEVGILNKLTEEESELLVKGVNNCFSDKTIQSLTNFADFNPMLLKLAASIINIQSPVFGTSGDKLFQQIERFIVKDISSNSGKQHSSHVIVKYAWNYLSCKHSLGIFAQQIIAMSVYMKTWIPISVLHAIQFPSSTYEASNIADGEPVSAVTCNLIQNLGLLLPHSTTRHVSVSNLMKDYVYNHILSRTIPNYINELILLNMRFTEGFISSFIGSFDIVKDIVSSPINEVLKDHVMSMLRKPFSRLYLSQSKGVATEVMLKKLQRLIKENEIFSAEERIEIMTIIHENQFYAGDFQNALDNLHQDWINSQELLKPGSKTYFRITQSICFFLQSTKSEDAGFYFNKILESGNNGVVDEEALSAHKTYYESWAENSGASRTAGTGTEKAPLSSTASKHQKIVTQPYFKATDRRLTCGVDTGGTAIKTNNFQSIVQDRLTEIVRSTTLSLNLCKDLKEKDLVTQEEYEELTEFVCCGRHIQGAAYLFTTIVRRFTTADEDKFIGALREGNNNRTIKILRLDSSGKDKPQRRCPLDILRSAEIKFLRGFQTGKFTREGKFEGLNFEDEEVANEVLSGSVVGGSCKWILLEMEGFVVSEGALIQRVQLATKCLQEGSLWWNPKIAPLPPNFIPRRVRRLTTSGNQDDAKSFSELTKAEYPFLLLVDSPGSGKSTVTTKLEDEWRISTPTDRLIVRINLNLVQQQLQQQQDEDDFSLLSFLRRFVPFLPVDSLSRLPGGSVKVVVLLDALDEVLPQHEGTMLRLLHKLLLSPQEAKDRQNESSILRRPELQDSLRLEKLFLTTRPHLRILVEEMLGVDAYCLLPLAFKQQIEFLSKEVSQVFEFSEDDALKKLNSLHGSARGMMDNPLMIFLFAQLIKKSGKNEDSADFDIFSLYESFFMAKHAIYVADDPTHPETQQRMKNLLEENLPFYYATALTQLKPEEVKTWAKFVTLPNEKKREELLSFGLLTTTTNSSHQPQFVHLSFAEFLYTRLLTAPSTPTPLRDCLFTEIYSGYPVLTNVEEFVLCALRRRKSEFPTERLLPLSPNWLSNSTWWEERMKGQRQVQTLEIFLRGRLFPLLGEELLSSVDLTQPIVIDALTSEAAPQRDNGLREWLTSKDPQWIRRCVFSLPPSTTPNHQWTYDQPALVTRLLCEHPQFLSRCLRDEEIGSGLSSCNFLISKVCDHPNSQKNRKTVERMMGREALRVVMMTWDSLRESLCSKDAAWWMAEVLTKEDLTEIVSRYEQNVLGRNLRQFQITWGGAWLYTFIAKDLGTKPIGHTQLDMSEVSVERVLRVFGGGKEGVAALRLLIPRVGDTRLLEELEELEETRADSGGVVDKKEAGSLLSQVVGDEGSFLWDQFRRNLKFDFLPFAIRYNKGEFFTKRLTELEYLLPRSSASAVGVAFVLSVLVDPTNHTHSKLLPPKSTKKQEFHYFPQSDLYDFLSRVGVDDLRATSLSAGLSNLKGQWPLVRQVNWGQVVLRLLPKVPLTLSDDALESVMEDFLCHVPCCATNDLLLQFVQQNSSLRELLLRQLYSEVTRARRPEYFKSQSQRCRMRGLIQFAHNSYGPEFKSMSTNSNELFLMRVILEIRLPSPHGHSPRELSQDTPLIQKLQRDFPSESKGPKTLLRIFAPFVTEWEWSGVLETLQIIPNEQIPQESPIRFYKKPATPLLRVWLRHFGVDETRKIAEDLDWSEDSGLPGEAVLLAVELGSLPILEKVAWPSLLWWRDEAGSTLLEVAVAKWGDTHEVTTFLKGKFSLAINSK